MILQSSLKGWNQMKGNVLEYKGYHTCIQYECETNTLRGVIEGIKDYVDFESDSTSLIVKEFHSAVDDYIAFCKSVGKEPEKEYKGSFNIRIKPELHKELAFRAASDGESINKTVEKAIENYLSGERHSYTYNITLRETGSLWGRANINYTRNNTPLVFETYSNAKKRKDAKYV